VRAHAEDRPGIYRMLDEDGEVLYVGKSVRIRSRLLSYFRASPGDKAADIVRASTRVSWEYVPNEFWALVRELRLIKRWRPRYNVEHRRSLRYAFLKVTPGPAPRILPVTRVVEDGSTYYGPFPRPARLVETVRELVHALGIRDCPATTPIHFGDQLEIFHGGRPPRCMRADTGSCLAPCAGRCTEQEYTARVRVAHRFLEGRTRKPILQLEEAMGEAARRRDFEYAALLRDRARRLARFQERLSAFRGRVASLSFVYRVPGYRGDDRLYLVRRGRVVDDVPHPKDRSSREEAVRRVSGVFPGPAEGPADLRSEEAAEILLVARWFRRRPEELERTWEPREWLGRKRPA